MPFIYIAFLRDVSHAACALFSKLHDELQHFIGAPRRQQSFRYSVKLVGFHLGILHSTVESSTHSLRLEPDHNEDLINSLLFFNKISLLQQLRRLGFGFDRRSFQDACSATSSIIPAISFKVSHPSILLPPDASSALSSEHAIIDAKLISLANNSTKREKAIEGSSQHEDGWTAEKVAASNSSTPLSGNVPFTFSNDFPISTPLHDAQFSPAPSAFLPDLFSEPKQALSHDEASIRLGLLQSELDDVCRDIDAKLARRAELENLIKLTSLSSDSDLAIPMSMQQSSEPISDAIGAGIVSEITYSTPQFRTGTPQSEEIGTGCRRSAYLCNVDPTTLRAARRTLQPPTAQSLEAPDNHNPKNSKITTKEGQITFDSERDDPTSVLWKDSLASCIDSPVRPDPYPIDNPLRADQYHSEEVPTPRFHPWNQHVHLSSDSYPRANFPVTSNSSEGASHPQTRTQRWRKSIGDSVKALGEGFGKLSLRGRKK
ncbi:MAG: hypothetical protein Q9195_008104 [Heterodermia aff. obscurata]